jgi:hypothetical protein
MATYRPGTPGATALAQSKDRDIRMFSVEMSVKVGSLGEEVSETVDRAARIYGFITA